MHFIYHFATTTRENKKKSKLEHQQPADDASMYPKELSGNHNHLRNLTMLK
jgi:hypothetical protein